MNATTTKKRWWTYLSKEDWNAFFAAWLGVLLDGYDFVLIAFALPLIIDSFKLTLVEGAALISAAFVSRWLGGLLLGAVGDKWGRKPAMVLSIFMFAFGSIACAFAPNYWFLFVFRLIIGFAMAGEYSASATYVIESWPVHMRNKASGFLLSGYAFGVILAAQVTKYLVAWVDSWHPGWGWRALFLTGVVPIAVAIYMRRRLPEANDWEKTKKSNQKGNDMLDILFGGKAKVFNVLAVVAVCVALGVIFTEATSSILIISICGVISAAVFISLIAQVEGKRWIIAVAIMLTIFASFMYTWPIQGLLPTYLKGIGMTKDVVTNVVSFAGLGNACGYIIAGFMGDLVGMRRWYAISLLLSQIIVIPLFTQKGGYVVLVAALLFFQQMFGQGVAGLLPKWVASYFPVEKRAAGLGFCYNVGALGGAVGPVLGAAIASKFSLGGSLAIMSVGFAMVVLCSIAFNIPKRLQRLIDPSVIRPEDGEDENRAYAATKKA